MISFSSLKIKAHLSLCTFLSLAIYQPDFFNQFQIRGLKNTISSFLPQPTLHFTYVMILTHATMESHSPELSKMYSF